MFIDGFTASLKYVVSIKNCFNYFQLDYYTLATPSHWLTIQDVRQEVYTLTKLPPLTTILVIMALLIYKGCLVIGIRSKVNFL